MKRRRREAASIARTATRTAFRVAEVGWLAPWVIAQRTVALAARAPTAAQRRDRVRMVAEKPLAAWESAHALWLALAQAQQRAWLSAFRAGRGWPSADDSRLRPTTVRNVAKALTPIAKRVRANAKRLSRR